MYIFLVPLLLGFTSNFLSAFTTTFSRRWGERNGTLITMTLRAILGIPLWATGFAVAIRAPSSVMVAPTIVTAILGLASLSAGCMIIYSASVTIRAPALLPSTRDALVQSGIYAHIRHPMDAGSMLLFIGLLLLRPTQIVALACAIGIVWALMQARAEELDLLRRLPDYKAYMGRVPPFVPRFRTK